MRGELRAAIEHRIMHGTTYRGVQTQKQPADAWVYQEIIHELRPEVVVEVGNRFGGSLLYLADVSGDHDLIGVDIDHGNIDKLARYRRRISLITGDAIAVFPLVAAVVAGRSCLVIEDSSHTYDHTLAVLRTYSALIQPGGYLICEDGLMEPVAAALRVFSYEQQDFEADRSREWPVTWNPGGYLKRVA